ncbi:hypothetical protein T458_05670 [Brevibacillus panacihumi W25]|uniref:Uncharacterized protein n=1 Tax=Brevibacillus panacihumi W25 TaxID=1408254 RepID=V6MCL7_9BACL|nr:hypothetical protein T458_05670 [Brevibacillus panacihumi W25]
MRVGIFAGGVSGSAALQRRNRDQKQPLRRSGSRLVAKRVFRLFRSAWVQIPNAFDFPLFPRPASLYPPASGCGFLIEVFTNTKKMTPGS